MRARLAALLALVGLLSAAALAGGCGFGGDDPPSAPQLGAGSDEDRTAERLGFPNLATRNTLRIAGGDPVADVAGAVSAVFPATSPATRPRAVVLADRSDWPGIVAAAVLAADPLGLPILLSDGDDLPAASRDTLERLAPRGSDLARDAQVVRIGPKPPEPDGIKRTAQLGGPDVFTTAAAIDRFFSAIRGEPSANVIVVADDAPAFAMPAAAWAARSGDSVLFVQRGRVPAATRRAIAAHSRPNIYLLGPRSVISPAVARELRRLGRVRRVSGRTPIENAIALARYRRGSFGWGVEVPGYNFTLASVDRPADAAAGAVLATNGVFAPLLLTDRAEGLPPPLAEYLLGVQPGYEDNPNEGVYNRVWILGDEDVVSPTTQGRLDEITRLVRVQLRTP